MNARRTSGFTQKEMFETKVYLRSFNEAVDCLDDIAHRESAKAHYKSYIKQLVDGACKSHLMLDKESGIVAAQNLHTANIFRLMVHSRDIVQRYGLNLESMKDKKDFESRLDRTIKGLETEIGLKQAHC